MRPLALRMQGDLAARLALPGPGPDGADGDDGLSALDHRGIGPEEDEIRPGGHGLGRLVHDVFMGDVAVGEVDVVDLVLGDEGVHLGFRVDGDALGIQLPRERRGILAALDVGDLGGRERHDPIFGVVPEISVEVVEIPSGGSQDEHLFHVFLSFRKLKKSTIRTFLILNCQEIGLKYNKNQPLEQEEGGRSSSSLVWPSLRPPAKGSRTSPCALRAAIWTESGARRFSK